MVNEADLRHLRRCVELAAEALAAGDEPFGSVLVGADGTALAEDHNRVADGDHTRHPEFALARWAAANLTPAERAAATVYTSGEHCPMCAAAHAWVGLGRVVYASSSEQLGEWLGALGVPAPPVRTLPVSEVAPGVKVEGPVPELAEEVRELHRSFHGEPNWERRVAQAWLSMDEHEAAEFRALIEGLAAELPEDSALAAFERGCVYDSTGLPERAVPEYRRALELGLTGVRRRRVICQLASSLRNLGRPEESVELLTAELARTSDVMDDAVRATLALALTDVGREREAVSVALTALAPHLPRYQRSMANYARALVEEPPTGR
ncbi:tetratricopeptide repeat protein [Streptomyces sp. 8K308]|nr:tetratricopeptide repeat protein [Streptomyces sp. 8K308]